MSHSIHTPNQHVDQLRSQRRLYHSIFLPQSPSPACRTYRKVRLERVALRVEDRVSGPGDRKERLGFNRIRATANSTFNGHFWHCHCVKLGGPVYAAGIRESNRSTALLRTIAGHVPLRANTKSPPRVEHRWSKANRAPSCRQHLLPSRTADASRPLPLLSRATCNPNAAEHRRTSSAWTRAPRKTRPRQDFAIAHSVGSPLSCQTHLPDKSRPAGEQRRRVPGCFCSRRVLCSKREGRILALGSQKH